MTSLGETLGAIELGVILASVLYGIMLAQVYNYCKLQLDDGEPVKVLVRFHPLLGIK